MMDTRRSILLTIAGLALLSVLSLGAYLLWRNTVNPYYGLTVRTEVQLDEATRTLLMQRIATTESAIAAQIAEDGSADNALYLSLASDANMLGDLVTAREALAVALNQNSLLYATWNTYANVLHKMGDIAPAEDAYREAIGGGTAEYYMDYVRFLAEYHPDRDDEILAVLNEAVAMFGQRTELMVALAEWYRDHDDCTQSEAHYKVAITTSPDNSAIKDDLAVMKATCGKSAE